MALDIKVYARKGWATCARTKEFLSKNGFEYIERDIQNDSGALQELRDLGFRAVPVTVIGETVINGFNPRQLSNALSLSVDIEARTPRETLGILEKTLASVEKNLRLMPDDKLDWTAPDRDRPMREFGYHMFMFTEITMIGLDSGNYPPRSDLTGRSYNSFNDIADYGKGVLEGFKSKVSELDLDKLAQIGPRGEDDRSVSERLDLVAGHTVQHLRQLYFVLREFGIEPIDPIEDSEFPTEYVLTILW